MELAQFTHVKVYPLTGGTKISEDVENIRNKAQILITTPGRITNFCTRNLIDISQTSTICIDEADSIIRNGQNPIIDSILSKIPTKCQFLLFSATFPRVIASFRDKYMKNTVEINTMKEFTLKGVTQFYAFTEEKDKISCVYTLLSKLQINQCIIFCNSINRVRLLTEKLMGLSMSCRSIHSKMPQSERVSIFEDFKLAKFRILVCTGLAYFIIIDVFNRGIDIQAVNVVINFDLPTKSATYLHRIGRSGRFGHIGIGISFVSDHDKEDFLRISKELSTNINPIPKNAEISKNLYVSNIPVQ
uniref:Putative ATP-dependent RNA helicase ddx6 (Trinotate prediction) n=1 Tax=Henneguya salminicola TaxID=69463 RepID=A0A6G3MEJ0_HENSL